MQCNEHFYSCEQAVNEQSDTETLKECFEGWFLESQGREKGNALQVDFEGHTCVIKFELRMEGGELSGGIVSSRDHRCIEQGRKQHAVQLEINIQSMYECY